MKISIASDHAGFEQKQQLAAYLKGEGHEVIDRGPDSDNRVDYPDFAVKVGEDVQSAWRFGVRYGHRYGHGGR